MLNNRSEKIGQNALALGKSVAKMSVRYPILYVLFVMEAKRDIEDWVFHRLAEMDLDN